MEKNIVGNNLYWKKKTNGILILIKQNLIHNKYYFKIFGMSQVKKFVSIIPIVQHNKCNIPYMIKNLKSNNCKLQNK
jgi:hypothetical protein